MENKRPTGRKRNVTGKADSIHRRGENLGTGPVGNSHPNNFGGKTENIHVTGKTGSGRNLRTGNSDAQTDGNTQTAIHSVSRGQLRNIAKQLQQPQFRIHHTGDNPYGYRLRGHQRQLRGKREAHRNPR